MNWTYEIQWQDTLGPTLADQKMEEVYTLYMGDFLKMPTVDYHELSELDPQIRALFN